MIAVMMVIVRVPIIEMRISRHIRIGDAIGANRLLATAPGIVLSNCLRSQNND